MTDQTALALIASIGPTIAAAGAVWIGLLNARRAKAIAGKADAIAGKADELHEQNNHNLQMLKEELRVANARIIALEKLISSASQPGLFGRTLDGGRPAGEASPGAARSSQG